MTIGTAPRRTLPKRRCRGREAGPYTWRNGLGAGTASAPSSALWSPSRSATLPPVTER